MNRPPALVAGAAAEELLGRRVGIERAGRVVAVALQHLVAVVHGRVGRDVAAAVAAVDADHQRQLLAFAVGHGVVRQGVLAGFTASRPAIVSRSFTAPGTAEVVLVPVEVVLGRDLDALEVLLHDEVDDAGHRVRAVHGRCAAGEDVDALDHLRRDLVDVRGRGCRGDAAVRHAPAVDQHQRAGRAEAAQVQCCRAGRGVRHRDVLRRKSLRQLVDEVLDAGDALRHDIRRGDLRDGCRRLEVRGANARTRDDDLTQVFLRERRCRTCRGQSAHEQRATYGRSDLVLTFHC